jgi:hypothetical protein
VLEGAQGRETLHLRGRQLKGGELSTEVIGEEEGLDDGVEETTVAQLSETNSGRRDGRWGRHDDGEREQRTVNGAVAITAAVEQAGQARLDEYG